MYKTKPPVSKSFEETFGFNIVNLADSLYGEAGNVIAVLNELKLLSLYLWQFVAIMEC